MVNIELQRDGKIWYNFQELFNGTLRFGFCEMSNIHVHFQSKILYHPGNEGRWRIRMRCNPTSWSCLLVQTIKFLLYEHCTLSLCFDNYSVVTPPLFVCVWRAPPRCVWSGASLRSGLWPAVPVPEGGAMWHHHQSGRARLPLSQVRPHHFLPLSQVRLNFLHRCNKNP